MRVRFQADSWRGAGAWPWLALLVLTISALGCSGSAREFGDSGTEPATTGTASPPPQGQAPEGPGAGETPGGGSGGGGGAAPPQTAATGPGLEVEYGQWTWSDVAGTACRDGSPTGIGARPQMGATKLMIFLQPGGACISPRSCLATLYQRYSAGDFNLWTSLKGNSGIFDLQNPDNPFADYHMVFIPYCTGDVHAGNNPTGAFGSFTGYANVTAAMHRVAATFGDVERVVLAGTSAGGFGAIANYENVKQFFSAPVDVINDAAPPMSNQFVGGCLQDNWRTTWNLDQTVLKDCGAACATDNFLADYLESLLTKYPEANFSYVGSTADTTIRLFFGTDQQGCKGPLIVMPEDQFRGGLNEMRDRLGPALNFHSFIYEGSQHTVLDSTRFYQQGSAGVSLRIWTDSAMLGQAGHIGP